MHKIECPHCHKEFEPSNESYADLVNQVRNKEFRAELDRREEENKKLFKTELEKAELLQKSKSAKEIEELQSKINKLKSELEQRDTKEELAVKNAQSKSQDEINELKEKLIKAEAATKTAVSEAINENNEKHNKLENELKDQIQYYKSFKQSLSTKMIGESLERYCHSEFNKIRTATFPNAYFEKDNDTKKDDEKADFMYRDYTDDKIEYISAMIEMKHEADDTKNKHKIDSFFEKLDKDRKAKNCEYAILVTTLEADSELYNGITDVSWAYPKMYVVRPQCFISMLTLLKLAALKSVESKREIAIYKQQNVDITNFDAEWNNWKSGFKRNMDIAARQYTDAIEHINDSIKKLTKARDELESSLKQLGHANDKVDDVTLKKLTKNSPSLQTQIKKDSK